MKVLAHICRHPLDFLRTHILPAWAQRTTIFLVMQTIDNRLHMRLGRGFWTLFRRGLVTVQDDHNRVPSKIAIGHDVTRRFARKTGAIPDGSLLESLLNMPLTAHILGGCPIGLDAESGRDRPGLPGPQLSRPVRRRWLDHARQPGRQPQPDDHRPGGIRHEPHA